VVVVIVFPLDGGATLAGAGAGTSSNSDCSIRAPRRVDIIGNKAFLAFVEDLEKLEDTEWCK
jgi:hypothetical protein